MDKQRSWSLWWVNFEANSESLKFKWSVGVLIRIQWGFCVWNCDHVIVISTHTARHLRGAKILSRLSHMVIILYKIWNDWNLCIMYVLLLDDSTLYDFKLAYRRSHALQRVTGLNWISNYNFQFISEPVPHPQALSSDQPKLGIPPQPLEFSKDMSYEQLAVWLTNHPQFLGAGYQQDISKLKGS